MHELVELHRFNAWANRRLLAGVRRLEPDQLRERREGMYNSVLGVMTHLAGVELGYLGLMRSQPVDPPSGDLDEVERALDRAGEGLVELAQSGPLEATFRIPWLDRGLTIGQGLRQVLTHSINHRADVNQWLPLFGLPSVETNYLDLVLDESASPTSSAKDSPG